MSVVGEECSGTLALSAALGVSRFKEARQFPAERPKLGGPSQKNPKLYGICAPSVSTRGRVLSGPGCHHGGGSASGTRPGRAPASRGGEVVRRRVRSV